MDAVLKVFKIVALASIAFAFIAVGYVALNIESKVETAIADIGQYTDVATQQLGATLGYVQTATDSATKLLDAATPVVAGLKTTTAKLNAAIDLTNHRLNDLCLPGPCGTLADTNRTLATLRGTSGQVEKSLVVFNKHEDDLFVQENSAFVAMHKSVTDFSNLVTNPDLFAVVGNAKSITGDAAGMTHDGRDWLHGKLYPTKKKGFVSGFEATGDVAKHWMPSLF